MARERDDRDDRDEDEDDRPRRPRRDRDDDYDDRPKEQLGPLDKMYRDTNIVVLVLFGLCCGIIAAALSLVCLLTAKDPKAKSNSIIVLVISGIMVVANIAYYFIAIAGAAAGR